tara:strand:+ start:3186 stop:3395 length:210 start_codon:yes stop_codon:yes gene_type:complete
MKEKLTTKGSKLTTENIISAGYNLEPVHCVYCDSTEVTYHQYVGDGYCSECGEWQSEKDIKNNLYNEEY